MRSAKKLLVTQTIMAVLILMAFIVIGGAFIVKIRATTEEIEFCRLVELATDLEVTYSTTHGCVLTADPLADFDPQEILESLND